MAKQKKRTDGRYKRTFVVNGQRYYVYGRSKQELDRKEYEKRQAIERGEQSRSNPTFAEYYSIWTDARRGSCSTSTLRRQASIFRAVSVIRISGAGRAFGELRLSAVTVEDIRAVQSALMDQHATQTVNDYIAHLSHVFKTAVDERRIDYNPCTLVKPLRRTEERARDTIHRALTKAETAAFFDAAAGSYYLDFFTMAINTGMRSGEIAALYTSDVRNGFINVERTITRLENGSYTIGDSAKTEAGRRSIPITDAIRAAIDHQREINRLLEGERVTALHDRIFKAPERGLVMVGSLNREIKKICSRAGIEYFSMHSFRATFATRALEQGMNPRTLQEILGHADFAITMNLYGHVLADTKAEEMKRIII